MAIEKQKPHAKFQIPAEIARSTILVDRFMNYFVTVGGIFIITIVFGIFIFILSQIIPLMRGASVEEVQEVPIPPGDYHLLGVDEWTELPFLVNTRGDFVFVDLTGDREIEVITPAYSKSREFTAFHYFPERQLAALGTSDGEFCLLTIRYYPEFEGQNRVIRQQVDAGKFFEIGKQGHPIRRISYGDSGENKVAAVIQEVDGKLEVHTETMRQRRTLMGLGELIVGATQDLTSYFDSVPLDVLVNSRADAVLVLAESQEVYYFHKDGDNLIFRQRFSPFEDLSGEEVASMDYLLGGASIVVTSQKGTSRVFGLYHHPGETRRLFGHTRTFPPLPGASEFFTRSLRNKAFLTGSGSRVSLRHGTTEAVRWEKELPFEVRLATLGGKYDSILFLDNNSRIHQYRLHDPHPEASLKALFGKVWYEGYAEPRYEWQSTGSTDDFEPKLSMIPLIIGTLKGTLYAMIFAVPISLLAAIYTSDFMHKRFKVFVKPTMEIMASLPSVVLGFLAALWVAPLLENRVVSVMLILLAIPTAALGMGWLWEILPHRLRILLPSGYEFIVLIPIVFFVSYGAWMLGPVLERLFCVVTDPATGETFADFRYWWPQVTGTRFEQRNSLVVGFMMGFAVIPIIFTITEDALSNVPYALRSGSLALGANRWQTAIKIVLPTASAGIFSAIMIGLGRAVGETMIVVMATGNTPILEWNIFTGMRTLSANIAVELPEAPYQSTLYRTLFLGAMVLFLMTFLVNTLAEVLRQHLRKKFRTVE